LLDFDYGQLKPQLTRSLKVIKRTSASHSIVHAFGHRRSAVPKNLRRRQSCVIGHLNWNHLKPVVQTVSYHNTRMAGRRVADGGSSPRSDCSSPEKGPKDVVTGRKIKKSYRTPATATDPEEVRVAGDFVDESGHDLANGWVLGKKLGQGMQGSIYLLTDKDGKDAGDSCLKLYCQLDDL
jgi:hypothetical protein